MNVHWIWGLRSARVAIGRPKCVVCRNSANFGSHKVQLLVTTLSCISFITVQSFKSGTSVVQELLTGL